MNEEYKKVGIVIAVALVAIVGLVMTISTKIPCKESSDDLSGQAIEMYEQDSNEESSETIPKSAGCCNWDCMKDGRTYQWQCRERDMDCSVGKPILTCRE